MVTRLKDEVTSTGKWKLVNIKLVNDTIKDFFPASSLFIPRGKVENFGTFPDSDFPPKTVFWQILSAWRTEAFSG